MNFKEKYFVVDFCAIGCTVTEMASALGLKVVVFDPYANEK
ncbi:MAG: hypothetical protein P9M03_05075 [Candidatus Theseobacter exili]|nr:hypothetical protein [Candidatus Theseobacter exili]